MIDWQPAPLGAVEHRRRAGLHHMLRSAHAEAGLNGITWPSANSGGSSGTLFQPRFVPSIEVRRTIRAETTKIESFNDFLDWISSSASRS